MLDKSSILLHPKTKGDVESMIINGTQSILIEGTRKSGKKFLALNIVKHHLGLETIDIRNHPRVRYVVPEKDRVIRLEVVREVKRFLKLQSNALTENRVVVIIDAEKMNLEAQNSLLKILEEPPQNVFFVLTTSNRGDLLKTILSRVSIIRMFTPTVESVQHFFFREDKDKVANLYQKGSGNMGYITGHLLSSGKTMDDSINTAKKLLVSTTGNRLLMINQFSKDYQGTTQLLHAMMAISQAGLKASTAKNDVSSMKQWLKIYHLTENAINHHKNKVNIKLLLSKLFINVSK